MHRIAFVLLLATLAGCTAAPAASNPPTPQPQIVEQTVVVVVTATPAPTAVPTLAPTAAPTAAPTLAPTAPAPTPAPAPTTAKATKAAAMHSAPDEGYKEVGQLAAGAPVTVLYRGGQWFQVRAADGVEGWVYRDWIDLPADQREAVPVFPEGLAVIVGKIIEEPLGTSTLFKVRVLNVGATPAYNVQVEIETFDDAGQRADLVPGVTDLQAIGPDMEVTFTAITSFSYADYIPRITWSVKP